MDVTVDVGKNIASMLERLAQQLGTTADKVLPWYVQQAYVEGFTTLAGLAIFLFSSALVFALTIKSADFDRCNASALISIVSGVILAFSVAGAAMEGVGAVRKVVNPNYYAMHMLITDIGRLVAK